jgi:hypothetical protein
MPGKNSVRIRLPLLQLAEKTGAALAFGWRSGLVYRCGLPCFEFGFSR